MSPSQFQHDNEARWQRLQSMLDQVEKGAPVPDIAEFPTLFRQTCHDLSVAQHRMYGARLVDRLNTLAIDGYRVLERRITGGWERLYQLLARDFPREVRAEPRLFWLCMAIFWLPFFFFILWTPIDPEWTMALLGPDTMLKMEDMYGHGTSPLEAKREEFGSDFFMFAYYIFNNVGIDLRTFASGLLGGVGTIFVLLFNGLMIGAAAGYVNYACNPDTFWPFVAGHSAPELMGIVISGMAGLRLGWALVHPGNYDRRTALVLGGRRALLLITGAALMTAFAAIIEGFWSATPMQSWIKYTFGACMWILVLGYLAFSGRERHAA
ncbi:MAG TPA: stage II sporulation protein M [Prosthecobacter sp.]|nr:stage II sporulation protein M [Prosthecobacter sp.]